MNYAIILTILVLIVAAWYAWRYYSLRSALNDYARTMRQKPAEISSTAEELENISGAISSLISTFNIENSVLDSERSRLATVLDQITDGVLIADAHGLIQFANPAAGRLFQFVHPVGHSIVEVVRSHQL